MARVEGIWARGQLTNNGPLVQELEARLAQYLGVRHAFFVSNGTIAIQLAIKALGVRGEIVTTPFSYVATTSSIVWEGCHPVFADVDRATLTIDPAEIERVITTETGAVLATHVFGIPCDVGAIEQIAVRHGIPVIYDAAHAFGTRYRGRALPSYGDVATLSFHATKLFHTIEGGAVVTGNDEVARRIAYMRNFGHDGTEAYFGVGINGKNSEMHAAMGLCVLPFVPEIIAERSALHRAYGSVLDDAPGVSTPAVRADTDWNFGYYPVLLADERRLHAVREALGAAGVIPRRYFYPSLNHLPYVQSAAMPVSDDAASRVLCLPLYNGLEPDQATGIARLVAESAAP